MSPRSIATADTRASTRPVDGAPAVSILLPTKNAGPLLARVLAQIFAQKTRHRFEVIVADSGSTDGTLQLLLEFPITVVHVPPAEFNHGGTRNLLASHARGEYLVFLTQDAVPADEHWLERLVEPLARGDAVGAYARQVPRADTDPINAFFLDEMYPATSRVQYLNGQGLTLDTVRFSNASSAMKRSVWAATPFRPDIIMAEDQDWSVRVLKGGGRIAYVAESRVEHAHHYTLGETFKKYFDSGVSYREMHLSHTGLRGIFPELVSGGLRHVGRKARYLWATRNLIWFPRAIAESAAKAVGLMLGRIHTSLPRYIVLTCSWHKYYWQRPATILSPPIEATGAEKT
ncbi:MAG TPA: glycosyltransferase [Candidatus Thermoplasmatota archaeon]|nr:glycosyltransferase [Candidatus Thermoplasmatota archaeon]